MPVKYSSTKKFEGSFASNFYDRDYFEAGNKSNYGRRDAQNNLLFCPYSQEVYLPGARKIVEYLQSLGNFKTAMVLGCAKGFLVQALREKGVEAVGVDISEYAIANAPREIQDYVYCGDVCDLSKWPDGAFDLVCAMDVLEHIHMPDLEKAIHEAVRVCSNIVVLHLPVKGPSGGGADESATSSDPTHVSIYPVEWWKEKFTACGLRVLAVNVEPPTPDGSINASIIFTRGETTPTPPEKLTPAAVKRPKILWMSNSPTVPTGYGVVTRHILYGLLAKQKYNLACLNYYGTEGATQEIGGLLIFPKMWNDMWGESSANLVIRNYKPDLFVTLFDVWIGGEWLRQLHPKLIAYCPVDHAPMPEGVYEQLRYVYLAVAMSQFGKREMDHFDIRNVYIPHGVDTEVFKPGDKAKAKSWLGQMGVSPRADAAKTGSDKFTVTINSANKGPRKDYPKMFRAIRAFLDQVPEAKKNLSVHVHSWVKFPEGYNLDDLALKMGVSEYVRFTPTFLMYCGLSENAMAQMYNAGDVFLNLARGEGFGIPILEAQSCGVPAIATDFSSMTELVEGHGWLCPIASNARGQRFMDTSPLNSDYALADEWVAAEMLEDAYRHPEKRAKFGEDARKFSLDYDYAKKIIPQWEQLFDQVLAEK